MGSLSLKEKRVVAILDLKVAMRSNDKTNIKYEFLIPQNPRKHTLISTIGQIIEKTDFQDGRGGGHLGLEDQNEVK